MKKKNLRDKLSSKIFSRGDVPLVVYAVVIIAMLVLWKLNESYSELAGDFFVEMFGVAFTLFIIDVLLVRSKSKRWKIVHDDVDYLISRVVNRLRDGLSYRAFQFTPDVDATQSILDQRGDFLKHIEKQNNEELKNSLFEKELFSLETYHYLNERATDVWEIINMKYSEYLSPILVSQLINLHACLKDLAGHNVQYRKSDRYQEDAAFYKKAALNEIIYTLHKTISLLNELKEQGFSQPAKRSFENIKTDRK